MVYKGRSIPHSLLSTSKISCSSRSSSREVRISVVYSRPKKRQKGATGGPLTRKGVSQGDRRLRHGNPKRAHSISQAPLCVDGQEVNHLGAPSAMKLASNCESVDKAPS